MNLSKFVHTTTGKYIMSILLGIGLATLFREFCTDDKCTLYRAPSLKELEMSSYKFDDKCYTYERSAVSCNKKNKDDKIVHFA